MITCYLQGGLGNQIFQIFAIIAYSLQHRRAFQFLYSETTPSCTHRVTYWNDFLKSLKPFTVAELPTNMHKINWGDFEYKELPALGNSFENVQFLGYFQSYRYFYKYKEQIYKYIQLAERKKECAGLLPILDNTISLHFRLGDYKKLPDFHPILSLQYYENALVHILDKVKITPDDSWTIYYFCEEEDIEQVERNVDLLKQKFPTCFFQRVPSHIEDWKQMLLMSMCHHNIIANSSFSWFGAFFNENPKKIVCYPDTWFGNTLKHYNTKDLFPRNWTGNPGSP